MTSKKTRTPFLGIVLLHLAVFVLPCWSTEECKECIVKVDETLGTVRRIVKGNKMLNPFSMEKVEICDLIYVYNLHSLTRGGDASETCAMPCTEKDKEDCKIQKLRISFANLTVTCHVQNFQDMAKTMFAKAGMTMPAFPKLPNLGGWFGGAKTTPAPKTTEVYASWDQADVCLEILMCVDDGIFNITSMKFVGKKPLVSIGGSSATGLVGAAICKMPLFKETVGNIANLVVTVVLPKMVASFPAKIMAMLNCGGSDEDDD